MFRPTGPSSGNTVLKMKLLHCELGNSSFPDTLLLSYFVSSCLFCAVAELFLLVEPLA
jgi:hypothetical protein